MRKFIILVACCSLLPLQLLAAEQKLTLKIESDQDPTSSVGLLISSDGTTQKLETEVKRLDNRFVTVSFNCDDDEVRNDSVATAMIVTADGEILFSDLQPVLLSDNTSALAELPDCPDKINLPPAIEDQYANLQKLVEIRGQRRAISQTRITRIMQDAFLEKLRKLERGFGLDQKKELAPDMNPLELLDRLSRLQTALRNYQANKKSDD